MLRPSAEIIKTAFSFLGSILVGKLVTDKYNYTTDLINTSTIAYNNISDGVRDGVSSIIILTLLEYNETRKRSSINNVTQFWTILTTYLKGCHKNHDHIHHLWWQWFPNFTVHGPLEIILWSTKHKILICADIRGPLQESILPNFFSSITKNFSVFRW